MPMANTYWKTLIGAGWNGIASARGDFHDELFHPPLQRSAWTPAAFGAAVGLLAAGSGAKRRTAGGMIGAVVGVAAAAVWTSRHFTRTLSRAAARRVNDARDAHWLELNPIDYA